MHGTTDLDKHCSVNTYDTNHIPDDPIFPGTWMSYPHQFLLPLASLALAGGFARYRINPPLGATAYKPAYPPNRLRKRTKKYPRPGA
nr:MAG TPA: hypothetical protein [Caudoviricetes sp.]